MAMIQKRPGKDGKPRWRVLIRIKNTPPVSETFERKTDAKRWAEATETAIRERRWFQYREAEKHTVEDLMDRFKKRIENDTAKVKAGQVMQANWWANRIGRLPLSELTPAVIVEQRDYLEEKKSGPTANRYMAVLSRALTLAVKEWGWMDDTPIRKVSRLKENLGRVRFLSNEEREALLTACRENEAGWIYPVVVLALSTGMRQGEILGLTWKQVDLQRGWIILEDTKNKDRRGVPVTGHALDSFKRWAKVRRIDSDRVFPGLVGSMGEFRSEWKAVVKAARLTDFRFHDLRHSAASALLMSGASLGEIADVLGHRTLEMVKRYSHVADDHCAAVVGRMNDAIFKEDGSEKEAATPGQ